MLRSFTVVFAVVGVVLLLLAFTVVADVTDEDCRTIGGHKIICKCEENPDGSPVIALSGDSNSTELDISDCANAELGHGFLIKGYPLEKISFSNIEKLEVLATFPSTLSELHLDRVGVMSLMKEIFSGDTRLKQLRIHNATIHHIKQDTFEDVAVENAHFNHVNFLGLEDDALAFSLNMSEADKKDHAEIHFSHCQFPDLDVFPISVAPPGKIRFANNILNCTNLARTYLWLDQMIGDAKQIRLLCKYLDENFCESKKDGNKLIRRIFGSGLLSKEIGMHLEESCSEEYKQYFESIKSMVPGTLNTGLVGHANLALLLLGFAVILLGV